MNKRSIRKRKKSRKPRTNLYMKFGIIILIALTLVVGGVKVVRSIIAISNKYTEKKDSALDLKKPEMTVDLLTVNEESRPGTKADKITGIVVHYTANPGSTAKENRDYFEGLKDSHLTQASSHFVVGLKGEIVQCVPTWELAYASNGRNHDTVSIECCHPDENGEFTTDTYNSVVKLTAWLCEKFGLTEKDVIRHYDVTGKNCPKFYVENEKEWTQFLEFVKQELKKK